MAYVNVNLAATLPPYLHLFSGLSSQAFSLTCWVRDLSPANVNHVSVYTTVGASGVDTRAPGLEGQFDGGSGNFLFIGDTDPGPEVSYTVPGASYSGWIFCAWTIGGTGSTVYYCGTESATPTVQTTATLVGIVSDYYIGHPFGGQDSNSKYSAIKIWNGVTLNSTQIATERLSKTPVTGGIFTYLSGDNGTTLGVDQSGNGNNWTNVAGGTGTWATDTDQPSVFPSNVSIPTYSSYVTV